MIGIQAAESATLFNKLHLKTEGKSVTRDAFHNIQNLAFLNTAKLDLGMVKWSLVKFTDLKLVHLISPQPPSKDRLDVCLGRDQTREKMSIEEFRARLIAGIKESPGHLLAWNFVAFHGSQNDFDIRLSTCRNPAIVDHPVLQSFVAPDVKVISESRFQELFC